MVGREDELHREPTAEERAIHARRRAELVGKIPTGYSPLFHLLVPSVFGLAVGGICAWLIDAPTAWEWLTLPITLFLGFGLEWRLHRSVLHQRRKGPLSILYVRHELTHHVVFRHDDMAMRSAREMRLILLPPFAIVFAFGGVVPLATALWLITSTNVALFFVLAAMVFFLSYEWLHLAYHLPPQSAVGRTRLVRTLRELHRRHHDPALMKRWNFNVTIPVFDVLYGTLWRDRG
jgi:hypothetical protein